MRGACRPGGRFRWRFRTVVAALLALLLAPGCGGGGGGSPSSSSSSPSAPPPPTGPAAVGSAGGVTVRIAPAEAQLEVGGTVAFSASVDGTPDTRVHWAVREPGGGTVGDDGRYAAPPVPGTYHVEVWSAAQPEARASATVTVNADDAWLAYLNYYRSLTRPGDARNPARRTARQGMFLPPVEEDPELSAALRRFAEYLAQTDPDDIQSDDEVVQGSQIVRYRRTRDKPLPAAGTFIDREIRNPFFRLWVLSPFLERVGYARISYDSRFYVTSALGGATVEGTATVFLLNVLGGRNPTPPSALEFPLFFPGPDTVVPLLTYEGEHGTVDPLAHEGCQGYEPPTGLPITLQLAADWDNASVPEVTHTGIVLDDGTEVEHCWYSEATYSIPLPPAEEDPFGFVRGPLVAQMRTAKAALGQQDMVVLIPRKPLEPGRRYTVTVTADGRTYSWSFRTWPPPVEEPAWRITPHPGTVLPGEEIRFAATDAAGQPVAEPRWVVNGMPGGGTRVGTITPGGTYRAPDRTPSPRVITVWAEDPADPGRRGEAVFTVAGIRVDVEPGRAVVAPGESVSVQARARSVPAHPGVAPDVDFLVEGIAGGNGIVGRIDPTGRYTAPDEAPPTGRLTLQARSRAVPWAEGRVDILFEADRRRVVPDSSYGSGEAVEPVTVRLAPAVAEVPAGTRVDFELFFPDDLNVWVEWSVRGADGGTDGAGTIDDSGLYTAPSTPPDGPVTVSVRLWNYADADTGEEATLQWTFQVVGASAMDLAIEPRETRVGLGQTVAFAVEGVDDLADVAFEVNGIPGGDRQVGTIDAQGVYTAPPSIPLSGNTVTVTARLRSAPWVWTEALVRLMSPLDAYVEPSPQRVALGARVAFAALAGGSPVPVDRWLVNGTEGGGPEVGTISADGVYQAPPELPDRPVVITVRAEGALIPNGAVEVAFDLVELVVTPPRIRTQQGGLHEPITVTARLSSGQALDLTGDPTVRAVSDNPEVATYTEQPEPGILVSGGQFGTTVIRFQDIGALGRATAGVVVEALPRYRLSTYGYGNVRTARMRSVFPLMVYRVLENGPNAGARVTVTADPQLRYAVEDTDNTGVGYVDEDDSRDPSTYTAVIIPSRAEIRVGEIPGVVTFRVEDPQLGEGGFDTFSVELMRPGTRVAGTYADGSSLLAPQISAYAWSWDPGLDSRDLEPKLQLFDSGTQTLWASDDRSAWLAPAEPVPVWVTPKGAPGVNGSAVLVVWADAPRDDGLFLRFRVDAAKASFVPLGLSYARRSVYMGSGSFQASSQERYARYYTRDGTAYLEVPLKESYVWTGLPRPLGSVGGSGPPLVALAEVVVHEPGPVDVTVEIPDTVQEPVAVRLQGRVPPLYGVVAWPQSTLPASGSAAEVAVAFPWALYGLTPVVEYKEKNADTWQRAEATAATYYGLRSDYPLHDAQALGPRVGGPGLSAGTGVSGFSAFFPLGGSDPAAWGGVFDIRVRYAEFPDEPVDLNTVQPPGPGLASGEAFAGDSQPAEDVAYVRAEHTVQLWTEARVKPVRVCAASYGAVRLSFPSADSYLNGRDPGAVTFSAPGQAGEQVEIPAGGCIDLTPNLNVGLEPGDVVAGRITAERLDADGNPVGGTLLPIYYAFTGAQVAVIPNLIGVPRGHAGDLDITLAFRGGPTFADALAGDLYRIVIVRDGQADLAVDGSLAVADPVAVESRLTVTFPLPAAYFETGAGPFRIRLEFGPGGGIPFWAGPVEVGLLDVAEPPPLLPLNATWPGESEPGVISGTITVSGTYAPFHLQLRLDQPDFDPPLAAFSRTATAEPNRTVLAGETRDLWITGDATYSTTARDNGRILAFRIYGDRTDLRDRAGEPRPDGLPDRVSGREGDLRLRAVRIDRDGTEHVFIDHAFTAFNFVAEHPPLRAPEAAPVADNLTAQQVYDHLSFQVDESKAPGEATPAAPKGDWEIGLYADNQINLNSGVASLIDLGYPGTSPNDRPDPAVLDGRWGDFAGEPPLFQPERPRIPTGLALEPFGVTLGGVCFDPWTFGRKRPNSDDLLVPLFDRVVDIDRGGFLYAQGGASGGWLAPPGFLVVARTPGVDLPGLDCGYLARGSVNEISDRFEDETGAGGAVYTFARTQGKRSVRTAVHIGGPGVYFEFTTDPAAPDGSPLCEAVLDGTLVLSRAPVKAASSDIVLTVRQDRSGALMDASAKVGVQVLASALAGAITASGPVGIAFSAGVAAAFQLADNAGLMPFGLVDGAVAGTLITGALQDVVDLTPGAARELWYELAPSALLGQRAQARAAQVVGRLDEVLVTEVLHRPDAWWLSPSAYFKSLVRDATMGAVTSAVASSLYDAFLNAETFSGNASAWAAVADQLALLIPEDAVVAPDTDTGLRGVWLARLKKRDLDLDRARALWDAIEDKTKPSSLCRVESPGAMPFYAALAGGVGPAAVEVSPRGEAPPASPGDEPERIADFRIHVDPAGGTRFPFISTTVVEAGRSDAAATARAMVNALDARITLRLVNARIERITKDGNSWVQEESR